MSNWSQRLASLFRDHQKRLENRVARNIKDREAAADIVQDVFCKVLNHGSEPAADETVKILYTSTRNAMIDHIRTAHRRQEIMGLVATEQIMPSVLPPDTIMEGKQSLQSFEKILLELGATTRDIFLLRRVQNMANADIARKYGISVSAVEKHIARAMRHCQKRMSDLSE